MDHPRQVVAIMFTDLCGYSASMQRNEAQALEMLKVHWALLRPVFARFNGREIKTIGDAFLIEFPSTLQAVHAGLAMQAALIEHNQTEEEEKKIKIRIGIHMGDVERVGNDVFGDGVNIASRIEPLAPPGGICISESVYAAVHNKIEVPFFSLGLQHLKNISQPVVVYSDSPEQARRLTNKSSLGQFGRRNVPVIAAAALLLIAVVSLLVMPDSPIEGGRNWLQNRRNALFSPAVHRLAVLPFENLSHDPDQDYFTDGMTEELIAALAKIKNLQVISRTSIMQYKDSSKSLPQIAKELGVDLVMEGSALRSGNRVRITAQLILAVPDQHLWAETYDRDLQEILGLQSEVARAVADAVKIQLTPREFEQLSEARKVSVEAHDYYLQGRFLLSQGGEMDIKQAIDRFDSAIQLEPDYALAYAGVADAYWLLADYFLPPSETMPRAKAAALKAVSLGEDLAEAHSALAAVNFFYDYDWTATEREARRAIELNPSLSDAHFIYANYLSARGLHAEADMENRKALNLDPLSVFKNEEVGWMLYMARRYEDAIEQLQHTLELDPADALTHADLALCYIAQNQIVEALAEAKKALQSGDDPMVPATASYVFGIAGLKQEARAALSELENIASVRYVCPYDFAAAYLGLGEKDRAFEWFNKAYDDRSVCMVWFKVDPRFDGIRSDARFKDLLFRMAL
jgi:TolB-like protein/class 3 adenylate cyclase/Tfp pilus assembly protein PilF